MLKYFLWPYLFYPCLLPAVSPSPKPLTSWRVLFCDDPGLLVWSCSIEGGEAVRAYLEIDSYYVGSSGMPLSYQGVGEEDGGGNVGCPSD
jgi:hypothetical protein